MTRRFALLLALLLPLAPLSASAAGAPAPAPLVEGEDYVVIADGKPFAPVAGKIEVAEIFSYGCPHCAHFEPMVEAWRAQQPKDMNFSYVPVAYELDDPFALGFFSLQAMGMTARTHAATFEAVHESGNLPRNPSLDELAGFYSGLGVNAAKFRATAASPAIAKRVQQARAFALGSGMEGTPSLVVNGKYLVQAHTLEDQLRVAALLVARERAARGR